MTKNDKFFVLQRKERGNEKKVSSGSYGSNTFAVISFTSIWCVCKRGAKTGEGNRTVTIRS